MKDKPDKKAAALYYDGERAPIVSAAGSGDVAEEIIAIAREHGVPLFENAELLQLLGAMDIGDEIPEQLYLCIAQVIAFAYKIQGKFPKGWTPDQGPVDDSAPLLISHEPPDRGSTFDHE